MSTMNGVVRAGMLEGMNTRKDPYLAMREVDMRKGRAQELANRFMSRGGYDILPDGSDEWVDEYGSGRSSSSSCYGRRREVTPSRSRDRERERGRDLESDDDSIVEETQLEEGGGEDARGKRQRKQPERNGEQGRQDR